MSGSTYDNRGAVVERRERLEGCDAALCPSVAYQLAGAKKVQQDLARPGVLDRFLDDPDDIADIQSCFAGFATGFEFIQCPQSVSYTRGAGYIYYIYCMA